MACSYLLGVTTARDNQMPLELVLTTIDYISDGSPMQDSEYLHEIVAKDHPEIEPPPVWERSPSFAEILNYMSYEDAKILYNLLRSPEYFGEDRKNVVLSHHIFKIFKQYPNKNSNLRTYVKRVQYP